MRLGVMSLSGHVSINSLLLLIVILVIKKVKCYECVYCNFIRLFTFEYLCKFCKKSN